MRLQKGGQAGAVAAGALDRPAAPPGHLRLGERQQVMIASRVCPYRRLGKHATYRIGGGSGEGVTVGIDPDHPIDGAS
jgi:hypothetical protein